MTGKLVHLTAVGGDLYFVKPFQLPPGMPDNTLPTIPGVPDNTLPETPPPTPPTGQYLIMVRTPDGKWRWAFVPTLPTPLPEPTPTPPIAMPPTAQPKA